MPRIQDKPILEKDISEFLENEADFAFEMKVLHKLDQLELSCDHAGTYTDPVTQKKREYDIRARKKIDNCNLLLAVECKNIRANSPLLANCVKRRPAESFHELIYFKAEGSATPLLHFKRKRIEGNLSIYQPHEFVAKKIDQVGRANNGAMIGNDGSIFEKISQAASSAYGLIEESTRIRETAVHSIIPILVIPDNTLWQVDYTETGKQIGKPRKASRCNFFIDQTWPVKYYNGEIDYTLSHLEITAISELENTVKELMHKNSIFYCANDLIS